MERPKKTFPKVLTDLLVDSAIFVAFLLAMVPHSTGISVHEWLSIALGATVIVHLLLHWKWIVATTTRFFKRIPRGSRINYLLNSLLFIDFTLILFTGIMISEVALPSLGIRLPAGIAWQRLHSQSADLGVFILGLHIALHWRWIVATFKRFVLRNRATPQLKPSKEGARS